ncbi:MAG: hypothetical protein KME17_23530 [Cyanosarcina radialis HA8281-LM2]|jgi:hypothetical protein|nr:hypothetical protein [Cyanosarcina radialis HA8281-LM2]
MKRLRFSQFFGGGAIVAGLAILPLALPATASNIPSANNYQIGRHGMPKLSSMNHIRLTQSTSNEGIGGGTNSTGGDKYQGMSDYQIGRHGLPESSSMNPVRSTQSTSNDGIGGGTNSTENDKYQGTNDYQRGRHGMSQ